MTDPDRPLSALPSPAARLTAFLSILVGGVAGGLIGGASLKADEFGAIAQAC